MREPAHQPLLKHYQREPRMTVNATRPQGVDIIIPTLNRRDLLERAVTSVRNQTHEFVSLFVVDQGSTDGTQEFLTEANIAWCTELRLGAGYARATGLENTASQYVLFLDSDDWLAEDAVEILLDEISSRPLNIVFGQAVQIDISSEDERERGTIGPAPLTSTTLISRDSFKTVPGIEGDNFSFPQWVIRARHSGLSESAIQRPIAFRGLHKGNVSRQTGATKGLFDMVRAHRELAEGR